MASGTKPTNGKNEGNDFTHTHRDGNPRPCAGVFFRVSWMRPPPLVWLSSRSIAAFTEGGDHSRSPKATNVAWFNFATAQEHGIVALVTKGNRGSPEALADLAPTRHREGLGHLRRRQRLPQLPRAMHFANLAIFT